MLNKLKLGLIALLLPLVAFGQSYPSPTFNNVTSQGTATLNNATVSGTFTSTGNIGLASLAAQAANTVVANVTASSASPTAFAMPSCSATGNALNWTTSTGFTCATGYASLASPTFTGTPAAPTATFGTNTTQVATTAFVQAAAGTGRLLNVQVFTSTGTYTPTAGTNSVIAEIQGAGGGSGGSATTTSSQISVSQAGGAGGYLKVRMTSGFSGAAVTVGAAGTAGTAAGNGGTGGNSSFTASFVGNGGVGGVAAGAAAAAATPGALGGATTGAGIVSVPGQSGNISLGLQTANLCAPGNGGSSIFGAGGLSAIGTSGNAGRGFGSGGGGTGTQSSGTAAPGGAGAAGVVIVYEFS